MGGTRLPNAGGIKTRVSLYHASHVAALIVLLQTGLCAPAKHGSRRSPTGSRCLSLNMTYTATRSLSLQTSSLWRQGCCTAAISIHNVTNGLQDGYVVLLVILSCVHTSYVLVYDLVLEYIILSVLCSYSGSGDIEGGRPPSIPRDLESFDPLKVNLRSISDAGHL